MRQGSTRAEAKASFDQLMQTAMTFDPRQIVVRCAENAVGAMESPQSSNAGPYVELCQLVTGNRPPDPWCASFVARTGATALGRDWPLPKTASCQALYDYAAVKNAVFETPEVGDVFVIWHPPLQRFAHAGFVVGLPNLTISGNTTRPGQVGNSREGWIVAKKPWIWTPQDRFIRWVGL